MRNFDRVVFLLAFVAATAGIIALRSFLPAYTWAPAAWAALVLTLFFLYTLAGEGDGERDGDNLYYLGLLFTLVSLGHSLYTHDFVAGGEPAYAVVSGFGVALSSTVLGILYRAIVQSYQTDLTASETQIRRELGNAMGHFRTELYQWAKDVGSFLLVVRQMFNEINEMLQESSRLTCERMAEMANKLEHTTERLQESLEKQQLQSAEDVGRAHEAMRQVIAQLDTLVGDGGGIAEKLDGAFGHVESRINEIGETIRRSLERQLQGASAGLDAFLKRLDTFAERLKVLESSPEAIVGEFRQLAQTLEKSLSPVRAVVDAETQMVAGIDEFLTTIRDTDVGRLSQSVDLAATKTAELSGRLASIGDEMEAATRRLAEAMKNSETEVQGHVKTSEHFRRSMQNHLEASRVMVREVHESLLTAARAIRQEVDGVENKR